MFGVVVPRVRHVATTRVAGSPDRAARGTAGRTSATGRPRLTVGFGGRLRRAWQLVGCGRTAAGARLRILAGSVCLLVGATLSLSAAVRPPLPTSSGTVVSAL